MKETEIIFQESKKKLEEINKNEMETLRKIGILELKLDETKRINQYLFLNLFHYFANIYKIIQIHMIFSKNNNFLVNIRQWVY